MSGALSVSHQTGVGASSAPRARFGGLLRGELRKLAGLRTAWVIAGVMTVAVIFLQLILAASPQLSTQLREAPLDSYAQAVSGDVAIVRILGGIFTLIIAAHLIGLEYQQGTIRILLGRGVGRLQLLGAQALALALTAMAFIIVESLIEAGFLWGISVSAGGASQPWRALSGEFWVDVGYFALYLVINAGVTLLLGVAAAVVGRSLAFGLTVGLTWFAVDNLLLQALRLLAQVTHSQFWVNLSGLLLGPLLNRLPDYILPPYHVTVQTAHGPVLMTHTMSGFGGLPLISVSAPHALLIIGLWSALFVAVAITITARRDIAN
ncbi:MAG TPA: ABC transporter permease subunit [Ktedonobacterales bacterium]